MKHKPTALYNEIYTAKKPTTAWHRVLVTVTLIIALNFLIYLYFVLREDVIPLV